ncbi:MAG: DUF434 domain-containing protein [Nitrososphaerota archaeon]
MLNIDFKKIKEAAYDLRFLLNRDYRKEFAIDFISKKYSLNKFERSILYRGVLKEDEAKFIKSKKVNVEQLVNEKVVIDGYNVLNTIKNIQANQLVIYCDDGVIRDISEIHYGFKLDEDSIKALNKIVKILNELLIKEAIFYYDSMISKSGELAALTRKIMEKGKINGNAIAEKSVDSKIIKEKGIVLSSDSIILLKIEKFFDLPEYVLKIEKRENQILSL